jgi:hypothetical protein
LKSPNTFALCLLSLLSITRPAIGQDPQYISPGSLANRTVPTQERVLQAAEEARWKFGRWRLNPLFSLSDIGYQENVFGASDSEEQVSDTHLVAGAGLDSYFALTKKIYAAAFVAPEYTYWNDLEQLRELTVNYGGGLFGFFNRLEAGLNHRSTEFERPLTGELEVPVLITEERDVLQLRVEVRPSLFLVGTASAVDYRHSRDLEGLVLFDPLGLDRDEDRTSAEVALRFPNGLELGLGVEDERINFAADPDLRSYSGTSPLLTARMDGNKIRLQAKILQRSLDFSTKSVLESVDEPTGVFRIAGEIANDTSLAAYGSRALVFSAADASGIILEDRLGIRLDRDLGRRFSAQIFSETGTLNFVNANSTSARRIDDLTAVGATIIFELSDSVDTRLVYSNVDYTSNFPQANRSIARLGFNLVLSGDLIPW